MWLIVCIVLITLLGAGSAGFVLMRRRLLSRSDDAYVLHCNQNLQPFTSTTTKESNPAELPGTPQPIHPVSVDTSTTASPQIDPPFDQIIKPLIITTPSSSPGLTETTTEPLIEGNLETGGGS